MLPIGKRRIVTPTPTSTGMSSPATMGAKKMIEQKKMGSMGSTPQFSPEATKKIQGIIDPTGANVGRQAVPMPRAPMMKKGGSVSSASKRADGIAVKGKTKGKIC